MSSEELSSDPFAFAFVKAHHREVPKIRRRRRRSLGLRFLASLGALIALSLFAASSLRAGTPEPVRFTPDAVDGGGTIEISPGDGYEIADQLAAAIAEEYQLRVRVKPTLGPSEFEGRFLPDVDGLIDSDQDQRYDSTATWARLSADAQGTIFVMVPAAEGELQMMPGADLRCGLVGLPYPIAVERINEIDLFPRVIIEPSTPDVYETAFVADALSAPGEAVLALVSTREEAEWSINWCAERGFPTPAP